MSGYTGPASSIEKWSELWPNLLMGAVLLVVCGFVVWVVFSAGYAPALAAYLGFHVLWLGPTLWNEFVAWIQRRLYRKESR